MRLLWLSAIALLGCERVESARRDASTDTSGTSDTMSVDAPVCGAAGESCCANDSCGADLVCTSSDQICRAAHVFVGGAASGMAYVSRGNGATFTADPIGQGTPSAIWGTSKDDVWVISTYVVASNNAQVSYARHWDGSVWGAELVFPSPGYVYALWGDAVDNYWAFTNGGGAYHWNGATWGSLQTVDSGQVFLQAWGASATNIWAIAGNRVSHWDGSGSWSATTRTDFTAYARVAITGRRASGEWWAGGLKVNESPQRPSVLHGVGSTLTVEPLGNGVDCANTRAVWAGPDDVWAVTAALVQTAECSTIPKLHRYTNGAWAPVANALDAVRSVGQMWGTTNQDIYLSGRTAGDTAALFHYNGTSWTQTYTPSTLTSLGPIWGVEGPN